MSQSLNQFLLRVKESVPLEFAETMATITEHYRYQPTRFTNGSTDQPLVNEAGSNEGSCKIFAFARLHGLNEEQTLSLFGDYYRKDVLEHPEGEDHRNIRNFMRFGWAGIHFDGKPLEPI